MLNGEVFEGGVASDFKMVLGKGSMIAGFEDGLLDIAAGKSVLPYMRKYLCPVNQSW
jgi:trigger factor